MVTRILPCACLLVVGAALAALMSTGSVASAGPQERLYLLDSSGSLLVTRDPVTLERLSLQFTGPAVGMQSLTYGQGRLFSIEYNVGLSMDQLISFHPASGASSTVGPTGVSYSNSPSIKYDPTRDEFFVLYQEFTTPAELWYPDLYRIDPTTGKMTYIARVTNDLQFPLFYFFPLTMAISPTGEAFVSEPPYGTGGPGIGRLHLESGLVEPLGRVPVGIGMFRDMSFDASGRLWAIFDDWIDNSKDGIYIVDPVALTFEPKLLNKDSPPWGMQSLAFVTLPAMSTYCEPSSGTTCTPTFAWKGLPSATATSGFPVSVRGTPSASTGILIFGNGAQSPPFKGSTLCFAPPYLATAPALSVPAGTGSPCDGIWSIDLNPEILAAGFAPGDTLHAQWMGLDPTAPAPRVTSNALMFDLAP